MPLRVTTRAGHPSRVSEIEKLPSTVNLFSIFHLSFVIEAITIR